MQTNRHSLGKLIGANKRDSFYELHFESGEIARLYLLADGIIRLFIDPSKVFDENHSSLINLDNFNNQVFAKSLARATSDAFIVQSGMYQVIFEQKTGLMSIFDDNLHRLRLKQVSPIELDNNQSIEVLKQNTHEYYFGAGLQNGSFSHKGKKIDIAYDGITGEGGVLSQVPFFWSNAGFGEVRNTAMVGEYDFGKLNPEASILKHQDPIFDSFYLLADTPQEILKKFYTLVGKPIMPPKYSLGLGHMGNFISTMWQPAEAKERNSVAFEDGNYYSRTAQSNNASAKSSLNGENEFQFSARALIDRYKKQHFALSWFVPNYGSDQVDKDALSSLNEYAHQQDVASGIWLNHAAEIPANSDFIVTNRSNKQELAWFNDHLQKSTHNQRSFMLTDKGSLTSHHQAGFAYGTNGGNWDNVAVQIASLLGASLSGQALVGASIDGTNGGGNARIALREFEWKTFTPLLFNIDDQGMFSKTPFAFNSKICYINQAYLKLRQKLFSYLYTLVYGTQRGDFIIKPLFIDFSHEQINYTDHFNSEFMLGSNLLIAPITSGREDSSGNSRKDNLYLPEKRTTWVDLFTGKQYEGGHVYNNLTYENWHLPVFVRSGSIFDFGHRNFVVYPYAKSEVNFYNDNNKGNFNHNHSETHIVSELRDNNLFIKIDPVKGEYPGMEKDLPTKLNILCNNYPDQIIVKVNGEEIRLAESGSLDAFDHVNEGFFFNTEYSPVDEFNYYQQPKQKAIQIKFNKRDITDSLIEIFIKNINFVKHVQTHSITDSLIKVPQDIEIDQKKISAHSISVSWPKVTEQVQFEVNGILYEGIDGDNYTFHELLPNTRYIMRMRYVAGNKVSKWSEPFSAVTKKAAIDYAISGIKTSSNYEAKPEHPLSFLTDLKNASEWEIAEKFDKTKPLEITFEFEKLEKLSRMTFVPRNIDHNSNPIEVGLEISTDGNNFEQYGDHYTWKADSKNKVIGLRNVTAKAIRLTVYDSSGNNLAAKEVIFYRTKD